MSKALSKKEMEEMEALTGVSNNTSVSREFDTVIIPRITYNEGTFRMYKDGELVDLGLTFKLRPLIYATKFKHSSRTAGKWQVDMETVLVLMDKRYSYIDNNGTIAGGRIMGAAAKDLSEDEQAVNRQKALFYGYLFGIMEDGTIVQVQLSSGKAMAVREFLRSSETNPTSTLVELALTDDERLTVNTAEIDLKLSKAELDAARKVQYYIDVYNYFTVIAYNKSHRGKDFADMVDYVSETFAEEYNIKPFSKGNTQEETPAAESPELDDEIPF